MAPTLPPKSPRMTLSAPSTYLHGDVHHNHGHPVVPITEPQQEISIDRHEEVGRAVGGIVYHPLGLGRTEKQGEKKAVGEDRGRIGAAMEEGEGVGVGRRQHQAHEGSKDISGLDQRAEHGHEHDRKLEQDSGRTHGGQTGRELVNVHPGGHELSRQPHRDNQETGPARLPAVVTAQHHVQPHTHHGSNQHQHQNQRDRQEGDGPRLQIQPPTPEHQSPPPPPLQIRPLNTSPPHTRTINPKHDENQQGQVHNPKAEAEGVLSRFKTTFLSKNRGPMSKTWTKKSYLDELESMAPTSPGSHSAPVSPGSNPEDLESGGLGMRRIA